MTTRKRGPLRRERVETELKGRLYQRDVAGAPRWYGDFRSVTKVRGQMRQALVAPGAELPTTDLTEARAIYKARLASLETRKRQHLKSSDQGLLGRAVDDYLARRRASPKVTAKWAATGEKHLERAVAFFGRERALETIDAEQVIDWLNQMRKDGLQEGTVRHHLVALSKLFNTAEAFRWIPRGTNPVPVIPDEFRPTIPESRTRYLTIDEAARFLEAARTFPIVKRDPEMRLAYPLFATALLTGGRADEVLGLEIQDIDFPNHRVHFRPNVHRQGRKGKTELAERFVPLWPQLQEILEHYLTHERLEWELRGEAATTLLFPSPRWSRTTQQFGGRFANIGHMSDKIAKRARLSGADYRFREFRVTYATHRAETMSHGEPISLLALAHEMGHSTTMMLQKVYSRRTPERAQRREVMEYRLAVCQPCAIDGQRESAQVSDVAQGEEEKPALQR